MAGRRPMHRSGVGEDTGGVADPGPRLDLRLVPSAVLAWTAALAGNHLSPEWTTGIVAFLLGSAVLLLVAGRWRRPRPGRTQARTGRRNLAAALSLACLLGAAAAAHTLTVSTVRSSLPVAGPGPDGTALVNLLVTGEAKEVRAGAGRTERWILSAELLELAADGKLYRPATRILVVGGEGWQEPRAGERIRAAGKLAQARPGQAESAVFTASTRPLPARGSLQHATDPERAARGAGPETPQSAAPDWAATMRERYRDAAAKLGGDPAGLLPGMVIGDTYGMDEELVAAMRDTGTTHLTAVSGANCSLILGLLILLARSCRFGRPAAVVLALCGLGAFVWLVGPEPSVLRAAVMGAIGLLGLSSGRPGRSLGFLCLAVAVLLVGEPSLAGSPGFLLSVLATLGIILLARPLMARAPAWLPRPVAAALAVPLSAQLFCAPVIVGLQPQFTVFSLLANIVMAPFVAPVTVLGTLAVPVLAVHEGAAAVLLGAAAVCVGAIAGIARFLAGLPGAVLPWPEGAWGMVTMTLCSAGNLALLWLLLHPARCLRFALDSHGFVVERIEGFEAWLEHRPRPFRLRMRSPAATSRWHISEKPEGLPRTRRLLR